LTLLDGRSSTGLILPRKANIDIGDVSFAAELISDSWPGAAAMAAATMQLRAYGSD
jgi:hypothetical protein